MYLKISLIILIAFYTLASARPFQTGHLVVALTDKMTGLPITNATVSVETLNTLGIAAGSRRRDYSRTSSSADSNGVVDVEFQFLTPNFVWWVSSPSHYCNYWGSHRGYFRCTTIPSPYLDIDTNTVNGLEKFNELHRLRSGGNLKELAQKFEPMSMTCTNNIVYRSISFFPKKNPQPMCAYERWSRKTLPGEGVIIRTNGIDAIVYPVVGFDLEKCSSHLIHEDSFGEVSDFKIHRYSLLTNGVRTFVARLDFAPGCGAYKRKTTGDDSFPTTYGVDTNAFFQPSLVCQSHSISNRIVKRQPILSRDEYLVLRTRVVTNSLGEIVKCNYSKILGEAGVGTGLFFRALYFNPRENDMNLEADPDNNLAESNGSCRWP